MSRGSRHGNDYDDEDVLYEHPGGRHDQRTLLGNQVKKSPAEKTPRRFLKTCLLCVGFLGLGLCTAILGTSLLDLMTKANGTVEQVVYVVTSRNVGVLLGTLVSGFCFDRFDHNFLLAMSLICLGTFGAMVPWCSTMLLLFVSTALWGIAIGFLIAGGNIVCVNLWGKKTGPFVQALHFSLGLGALIAPFIAEPFVAYNSVMPNNTNSTPSLVLRQHTPCFVNLTVLASATEKTRSQRSLFEEINQMEINQILGGYGRHEVNEDKLDVVDVAAYEQTYHARHLLESPEGTTGPPGDPGEDKATSTVSTVITTLPEHTSTVKSTTPTPIHTSTVESTTTTPIHTSTVESTTTTPKHTTTVETTTSHASTDDITTVVNGDDDGEDGNQGNTSLAPTSTTAASEKKGLSKWLEYIPHASQIQKAYMIIALYNIIVSIPFFWFFCSGPRFLIFSKRAAISTGTDGESTDGKKVFRFLLLMMLFGFFFLYKGMEESFGAYIYTFAKCIQPGFTSMNAVHLNAAFWGTFALGRLLAICIAAVLHPKFMLIPSLCGMVVAMTMLVALGSTNSRVLWSATVLLGCSMASVFPAAIAWSERYILLTGKAVASFFISASVAGILIPWFLGFLFQLKGITVLMKLLLALAVALFLLYIVMQAVASRQGERPSSSLPGDSAKQLLSAIEEEVLELENMAANNNPLRGRQQSGDNHRLSQSIKHLKKDSKND